MQLSLFLSFSAWHTKSNYVPSPSALPWNSWEFKGSNIHLSNIDVLFEIPACFSSLISVNIFYRILLTAWPRSCLWLDRDGRTRAQPFIKITRNCSLNLAWMRWTSKRRHPYKWRRDAFVWCCMYTWVYLNSRSICVWSNWKWRRWQYQFACLIDVVLIYFFPSSGNKIDSFICACIQ